MSTRFRIALLLSGLVSSVLFGIGAATILSIPSLSDRASLLLPIVIAASILLGPVIGWMIAPKLRAQWSREKNDQEAHVKQRDRAPA